MCLPPAGQQQAGSMSAGHRQAMPALPAPPSVSPGQQRARVERAVPRRRGHALAHPSWAHQPAAAAGPAGRACGELPLAQGGWSGPVRCPSAPAPFTGGGAGGAWALRAGVRTPRTACACDCWPAPPAPCALVLRPEPPSRPPHAPTPRPPPGGGVKMLPREHLPPLPAHAPAPSHPSSRSAPRCPRSCPLRCRRATKRAPRRVPSAHHRSR